MMNMTWWNHITYKCYTTNVHQMVFLASEVQWDASPTKHWTVPRPNGCPDSSQMDDLVHNKKMILNVTHNLQDFNELNHELIHSCCKNPQSWDGSQGRLLDFKEKKNAQNVQWSCHCNPGTIHSELPHPRLLQPPSTPKEFAPCCSTSVSPKGATGVSISSMDFDWSSILATSIQLPGKAWQNAGWSQPKTINQTFMGKKTENQTKVSSWNSTEKSTENQTLELKN